MTAQPSLESNTSHDLQLYIIHFINILLLPSV